MNIIVFSLDQQQTPKKERSLQVLFMLNDNLEIVLYG